MSKFGDEKLLPLLVLTIDGNMPVLFTTVDSGDDFLLAVGDVGVKLQEAFAIFACVLLLVMLLLLATRSETTVL